MQRGQHWRDKGGVVVRLRDVTRSEVDGVVFEDNRRGQERGGNDGPVTVRDHLTSDATLAYISTPMRLPQVQHPYQFLSRSFLVTRSRPRHRHQGVRPALHDVCPGVLCWHVTRPAHSQPPREHRQPSGDQRQAVSPDADSSTQASVETHGASVAAPDGQGHASLAAESDCGQEWEH